MSPDEALIDLLSTGCGICPGILKTAMKATSETRKTAIDNNKLRHSGVYLWIGLMRG